jgi:hypothetical protein
VGKEKWELKQHMWTCERAYKLLPTDSGVGRGSEVVGGFESYVLL